jgi:hypothetical protein
MPGKLSAAAGERFAPLPPFVTFAAPFVGVACVSYLSRRR